MNADKSRIPGNGLSRSPYPGLSGGSIRLINNYYFKIIARIAASGLSKYAGSIGIGGSFRLSARSLRQCFNVVHKLTGNVAITSAITPCYKFPLLSP